MSIAPTWPRRGSGSSLACARAGREPAAVTLVAVSKTHPAEAVIEAAAAGQVHFGENRVQEAREKIPRLPGRAGLAPGRAPPDEQGQGCGAPLLLGTLG